MRGGAARLLRRDRSPIVMVRFTAVGPDSILWISAIQDRMSECLGLASCRARVKSDVVTARPIAEPPNVISVYLGGLECIKTLMRRAEVRNRAAS